MRYLDVELSKLIMENQIETPLKLRNLFLDWIHELETKFPDASKFKDEELRDLIESDNDWERTLKLFRRWARDLEPYIFEHVYN